MTMILGSITNPRDESTGRRTLPFVSVYVTLYVRARGNYYVYERQVDCRWDRTRESGSPSRWRCRRNLWWVCLRARDLGVVIDSSRRFGAHIEMVCNRTDKLIGALRGILPNINGPPSLARRLYYNVWKSIVTYGAPVWARAANTDKNRKKLKRAQRTALCITTTAYRTVSHLVWHIGTLKYSHQPRSRKSLSNCVLTKVYSLPIVLHK